MKFANYTLTYNRKNLLDKHGLAPIEIQMYYKSKQRFVNTGIKIKPEQWNPVDRKVKSNHANQINLNVKLNKMIADLQNFELKKVGENKPYDLNSLVNFFRFENETNDIKFLAYAYKKLAQNNQLTKGSKRAHLTVLNSLKKFIPTDISFVELNYSFVQKYDNWLRHKQYNLNTIWNHHKTIKVYLNQAIREKMMQHSDYPYLNFKVKLQNSTRRGISREELTRIENLELTQPEMILIKDLFLFSCYTGLRFSDIQAINNKNLIVSENNYTLDFIMQKTNRRVILPLNYLFSGKALKILLKYQKPGQSLFPTVSNQYVNRILKLIATLANISETLTFHISRHTFCSHLAEIKPDPYLIKDLAGHADIRISMIYIHQSGAVIEKKLKEIEWN